MPFRRRRYATRRRHFKRRFKRTMRYRKRMPRTRKTISREPGGFPDRVFVKLKYARTANFLTNTTGAGAIALIGLNEPLNQTGFGIASQVPIGWSQYSSVYDNYVVHASYLKVAYCNLSTSNPIRATLVPSDDDANGLAGITNTNSISSNRMVKTKYLSISSGGQAVKILSNAQKVAKVAGVTKITSTDTGFVANTGSLNSTNAYSAPIALYQWIIGAQTANGVTLGTNQVTFDYEITYYLEFYSKLPVY